MAFAQQEATGKLPAAEAVEILDRPLHQFGFVFECFTPTKVSGRLPVTPRCCQPFNKLHGGISALISESTASLGGILASGGGKSMGIQLSINHLRSAQVGDIVYSEATPVTIGKTVQVWEVKIWKTSPSNSDEKEMVSIARVTNVISHRMSEIENVAIQPLKKYYCKL